jgi:type I restriction enzyme S subunit
MSYSDNWVACKLGDFITLRNGFAFKSNDYIDEGIPVIRISDIQDGEVRTDDAVRVSKSKVKDGFNIEKGDVLVAMSGATTGKIGRFVSNEPALQNQRVGNLLPKDPSISRSFIYYWILIHKKDIEDQAYGGAQPNISSKLIEEIQTKLPPLPEQKRIVAKLDNLFAHLDQLKARLQNIPALLKQFRQAVLTQAVTGKLTEEWRKENQIDYDWLKSTIGENSLLVTKGASPKWQGINYVDEYNEDSVLFITSENIDRFNIIQEKFKYLEIGFNDLQKRSILEDGDVLTNIVGGSIGRTAVWNLDFRANINQAVCIIRPDRERYLPEFLAIFLNSDIGLKSLFEDVVDVARANISLENIRNTSIEFPSLNEQREIIRRVESLFAVADRIEASYNKLQEKIDHLPQAILSKAFRGELVEQDSNDEPAEALLEQIKQSKLDNEPHERRNIIEKYFEEITFEIMEIYEVIEDAKRKLTAKEVWQKSRFKDDIDGFYAELKEEVEVKKRIKESEDGKYLVLVK